MTASGRRVRLLATAVVAGALLAGSLVGSDDWFPVGPFRMYATSGRATGEVRTAALVAVTAAGDEITVGPDDVGLRRAELEGQLRRLRDGPHLLGALGDHLTDRWGTEVVTVRLEETVRPVVDRRPAGEAERRVVAEWRR
jgi:hypothetical protein